MIKAIIRFFKRRKIKREIKQCSFHLESMEFATKEEWEKLNFDKKYDEEREKKRLLIEKLSNL